MIEIKLETLVSQISSINRLISENKLPCTASYSISKVISKVNEELKLYEQVRNDKIKELGEEIEEEIDGKFQKVIKVTADNQDIFNKEMFDLLNKEIKIDLPKLKINELGQKFEVEPNFFLMFSWLFEE